MFSNFSPLPKHQRKYLFFGSSSWIPIQERLIGRVSLLKRPSRNSSDLYVFRVFPLPKHVKKSFFDGSSSWISIQERLIGRVSLLKRPSRNSSDLYVFRVFPLPKHVKKSFFDGSSSCISRLIRRVSLNCFNQQIILSATKRSSNQDS